MIGLPLDAFLELYVLKLMLVLTRVAGIFSFAPIVSSNSFPRSLRFYLIFAMTLLLVLPVAPPPSFLQPTTVIDLVILMVGELLVGFLIGSYLQFLFAAVQLGGQLAATQFGLALAAVFNPQLDEQSSTTAALLVTVASLIFFGIGGHREMIAVLLETFTVLPLGTVRYHADLLPLTIDVLERSMLWALRIAAPATTALLLTEVALGFVGRTVPQMNILTVGFALRLLIGILITAAAVTGIASTFQEGLIDVFALTYEALARMAPGSGG